MAANTTTPIATHHQNTCMCRRQVSALISDTPFGMLIAQSAEAAPAARSSARPSSSLGVIASLNSAVRRSFVEAGLPHPRQYVHAPALLPSPPERTEPAAGIRLPA